MISLDQYWMGRDSKYADELTDEIRLNAQETIDRVNRLLEYAGRSVDDVNSGWRPPSINEQIKNAAKRSNHLIGRAVDVRDIDRSLATWVADNADILLVCDLYCEDFRWTPTWVHFQTVPPGSGRRIYIPSTAPALDPGFPVTWA